MYDKTVTIVSVIFLEKLAKLKVKKKILNISYSTEVVRALRI